MASALLEHILCPVCLSEFSDPVSLRCQHTFCRECIKAHLATSGGTSHCPECRHPFTKKHIKANRTLNNLVLAAKHQLLEQKILEENLTSIMMDAGPQNTHKQEAPELMCPQHEERLKLFCETDQQLVCVVCRDGSVHDGHKFKPVEEKAQSCKGMLTGAVSFLSRENDNLDYLIRLQTAEIQKTKEKSKLWSKMISAEFEKLHQLLREKEQKVKKLLELEEQRVLGPMQQNLSEMRQISTRDRNTEQTFRSNLNISQPVTFLQWWTAVGCDMVEEMQDVDEDLDEAAAEWTGSSTDLQFSSKLSDWSVSQDSISLGPYETYLPFFVWRDILTHIKSVPHDEMLPLQDESYSGYTTVSRSGRSLHRTDRKGLFGLYQDYRPLARGQGLYQHGQHYWEVEVGRKLDWGIGVCAVFPPGKLQEVVMLYLKYCRGYSVTSGGQETSLKVQHPPWRVGVFLDCDQGQVSFYNADTQVQLYTASCDAGSRSLSLCLSPGAHVDGGDWDPLTVCCYKLDYVNVFDIPYWSAIGGWDEGRAGQLCDLD